MNRAVPILLLPICICLLSAYVPPPAEPIKVQVRYAPVARPDIGELFALIEQSNSVTLEPVLKITKVRSVRVTACSPQDPKDQEHYRVHGYEGNDYGIAAYLPFLPRGTLVRVPGYLSDSWVLVDSSGGSVIRRSHRAGINQIDVKFRTYYSAKKWGSQILDLEVIYPKDQNSDSANLKVRK